MVSLENHTLARRGRLPTRQAALSAALMMGLLGTAARAVAGCCPPAVPTCVYPVAVPERYVVEQGPIFTGPVPCLRQPNEPAPGAVSSAWYSSLLASYDGEASL